MSTLRKKVRVMAAATVMSALALGGALAAGTVNAESAQAATPAAYPTYGSFSIYYSPNCQGAYHSYTTSFYRAEPWINDTFNNRGTNSAGYGQKVRNNAASVRVRANTEVSVWGPYVGQTYENLAQTTSITKCYNLERAGLRNRNTSFSMLFYQG